MEPQASLAPVKVALLEDQRVFRDSLAQVLEKYGYRIAISVGRADELMALLGARTPDLLIVDLRVPPDGGPASADEGWRTIEFVREWYPAVRILVLAGSADPAVRERAMACGVFGFLHKESVSARELLEALARIADGQRVFPADQWTLAPAALEPEPPSVLRRLTPREVEVLRYIGAGFDNLKIAACLGISERTVRAHVSNLYKKLGPDNRAQLALMSRELGIKPPAA